MKTDLEIIKQIHDIERDLETMEPTPGRTAWEYYVNALKWVLGDDLSLIGHFEIADKKAAPRPRDGRATDKVSDNQV